ncbi:MAG: DNA polymerase III subunit gamma/tau [Candidatus Omnitrophica bacterium]|nr:DNA polymerase III subunit gamma/tau [Candidatus Omnitrophota bacterium]
MNYLVFARKFRPQTFDSVIGQEPITTTLQNSIRQERISQSFLFSGPRGVGKTSTARILAKALNCAKGPTEKPCGKCTACLEITQGNSMDVLEIDGASNRGIDEIRNLRETVKFKAINGKFKIYIIDEVHMLTPEAFNALLKTLEEPPPHVKFIFATTEPHKVPLTILSRCQRFNFKRIPTAEIVKKLDEIAKEEKLKIEKNALFLIAKASEGALRDAESLLDQLASFAEGKIAEKDVLLMLGLASDELYLDVLQTLRAKDGSKILSLVGDFYTQGRDLVQFAKGLLEIFRHLLVLKSTPKGEEFVELQEDIIAQFKKIAQEFSEGELLLGLNILGNLQNQLRRNMAPPRLLVETTLFKLLYLDGLKNVEEVLENFESKNPPAGRQERQTAFNVAREENNNSALSLRAPLPYGDSKKHEGRSAEIASSALSPGPIGPLGRRRPPRNDEAEQSEEEAIESAPVMTATAAPVPGEIEGFWPRVIEYVKSKRMSTGIFLSESQPVEIAGGIVTLGLPSEFQFHKDTLEKDSNRKLVEEAFEVVSGKKTRAQFVILKPLKTEAGVVQAVKSSADEPKVPDIIMKAMDIFGGAKIVRKE